MHFWLWEWESITNEPRIFYSWIVHNFWKWKSSIIPAYNLFITEYVLLMRDLPGEDVLGQLARLPPGPRPVARPQLEAEVEELGDHLQRRHLAEPVQGEPGSKSS